MTVLEEAPLLRLRPAGQFGKSTGEEVELLLWSIYVLEKRDGDWKITVLDWSLKVPRRRAG